MEEENEGSPLKRPKIDSDENELNDRVRLLMMCTVCRELPHPEEFYQCKHCHVICGSCVTRIFAEAEVSHNEAKCPQCRLILNWPELQINLVLRQTLWELATKCTNCNIEMPFKELGQHQLESCPKREVDCKYHCLGCNWHGAYEDCVFHEDVCPYPNAPAERILMALDAADTRRLIQNSELQLCRIELSADRIFYMNVKITLQIDDETHSEAIHAFEVMWRICLRKLNKDEFSYCLQLMSQPSKELIVKYFLLVPSCGRPYYDKYSNDIDLKIYSHRYTQGNQKSCYQKLPLSSQSAAFRMLAQHSFSLRLWMFLH